MKKIFLYLFLSLFFCNVGFAKIIDFKCSQWESRTNKNGIYESDYDSRWIIHMQLDTSKNTLTRFDSWDHEEKYEKKIYKIDNITENAYYSGDSDILNTEKDFMSFNRYTGILIWKSIWFAYTKSHWFSCEPTKQLY